jgi:hypothetical protein
MFYNQINQNFLLQQHAYGWYDFETYSHLEDAYLVCVVPDKDVQHDYK